MSLTNHNNGLDTYYILSNEVGTILGLFEDKGQAVVEGCRILPIEGRVAVHVCGFLPWNVPQVGYSISMKGATFLGGCIVDDMKSLG